MDAYVISLVAPHAVGRAAGGGGARGRARDHQHVDDEECSVDIDGQRLAALPPAGPWQIRTSPGMTSLALLEGDSLYHHFRDRLL